MRVVGRVVRGMGVCSVLSASGILCEFISFYAFFIVICELFIVIFVASAILQLNPNKKGYNFFSIKRKKRFLRLL